MDDKTILHEFLEAQRASVLAILDGLDGDALAAEGLLDGRTGLGPR